jgi:hypothetical protein
MKMEEEPPGEAEEKDLAAVVEMHRRAIESSAAFSFTL